MHPLCKRRSEFIRDTESRTEAELTAFEPAFSLAEMEAFRTARTDMALYHAEKEQINHQYQEEKKNKKQQNDTTYPATAITIGAVDAYDKCLRMTPKLEKFDHLPFFR